MRNNHDLVKTTKTLFSLAALVLAVLLSLTPARAATHYWTGGGSTEYWNNPANWTGGVPLIGEAAPIVLIFTNGVPTTNNINSLVVDSLQFHAANAEVHASGIGTLTIRGGNSSTNLWFKGNSIWLAADLPVSFSGTNLCVVNVGNIINIYSVLSGSGEVIWDGLGSVSYLGSAANTFSGTTRLRNAFLDLEKPAGVNAIAGPLILDKSSAGYHVNLANSNQIADSVSITIEEGKTLVSPSLNEKVGELIFKGGNINLVNGLLTLGGNVTVITNGAYTGSSINNPISLGGVTRTISVSNNATITFKDPISDGGASAGINVLGGGGVILVSDNTFTGPVQVTNSTLNIQSPFSLGTAAAGTIIDTNSTLVVAGAGVVAGETLTLAGTLNCTVGTNNSWGGAITLLAGSDITVNNTCHITLNGVVSGSGTLIKNGVGTLVLAGSSANTYSGGTEINGGLLVLSKTNVVAIPGALRFVERNVSKEVRLALPNQIANTATVTLTNQSVLNFTNNSDIIGALAGSSDLAGQQALVTLGTGTLTNGVANTITTFGGIITGTGPTALVKVGGGTFILAGSNTCSGACFVNQGTLNVNGTLPGAITVSSSSYLTGTGTVGQVTCNSAYLQPAGLVQGTLNTGSLAFNNNTAGAFFEIGVTTNDVVNVTGTVTLNNSFLDVAVYTAGGIGRKFTLIANDGTDAVVGTFDGLPEGATVPYSSVSYTISYKGGTSSNDVVLTQITQPANPQISAIAKQVNGQMLLTGLGETGAGFEVFAVTNLVSTNWVNLGVIYSDGFGNFSFTDTNAASFKQRFYRLKMQ